MRQYAIVKCINPSNYINMDGLHKCIYFGEIPNMCGHSLVMLYSGECKVVHTSDFAEIHEDDV